MLRCIQNTGWGRFGMSNGQDNGKPTVRIKKYANRRLYNTATSSYVTLDYLSQMVREGQDFTVEDAKTGEDITRSVLTQIIVEEEGKGGQNLLPLNFLRQLISFYGDNLQFLVPRYLEHTMESFARNQEQMRKYMSESLGGIFPFGRFDEMSKQNIAFFERHGFAITRAVCATCPRSCATHVDRSCRRETLPNAGCSPSSANSRSVRFQPRSTSRLAARNDANSSSR